ncbi:MAG: PQQ-dependent sugar dehydrogenase [Planctomycetota bacterium]
MTPGRVRSLIAISLLALVALTCGRAEEEGYTTPFGPGNGIVLPANGMPVNADKTLTPGKPDLRNRGGQPYGLQVRPKLAGINLPLDRGTPSNLAFVRGLPNLTFSAPTFVTHAPDGTDRLFVLEQGGRIMVVPNDDQATSAKVFLDIRAQVWSGGEHGLLGLAFDPDYATTGTFWIYYSVTSPHRSIVSRWQVDAKDPDKADATSEQVVLTQAQPYTNHNGGMIAFGPDKMLYIGFGDGGSGGDPQNNAQTTSVWLGKILRIDVRGQATYAVPKDNPFAGKTGWAPEIWALGLRNPWRFSFDRATGRLWAGDVGQNTWEEVDVIVKGGNYAWRIFEGTHNYNNPTNRQLSEFDGPVLDLNRTLARSITGGYVYRGGAIDTLRGHYVYGDYATGNVWALSYDDQKNVMLANTLVGTVSTISSFGETRDGELLVANYNAGQLYRVVRKGSQDPGGKIPAKLSGTGLFQDTAKLVPNTGLIAYDVNSPLWSDDAAKQRWIGVPDGTTIDFSEDGNWAFPVGTILVKHFEIDTGGASLTRLETRVLIHETNGWAGYTYVWNAAQTDADLALDGGTTALKVKDPTAPGGFRNQTWTFPDSASCMQCHTSAAGFVLGVRTSQVHRTYPYPLMDDDQLRSWNNIGLFTSSLDEKRIHTMPQLVDPRGPYGNLEQKARSYLEGNCAQCHRPGGPTPNDMDLRASTPILEAGLLDVAPTSGDLGLTTPRRVLPGKKESSVLWERMRRLDQHRMPPLGSSVVDQPGVVLVGQWIDGL